MQTKTQRSSPKKIEKCSAFARNLRLIITERGLTQKDLAKQVGVSPLMISFIINGRRLVSLDLAMRICVYLDVGMDNMFKAMTFH